MLLDHPPPPIFKWATIAINLGKPPGHTPFHPPPPTHPNSNSPSPLPSQIHQSMPFRPPLLQRATPPPPPLPLHLQVMHPPPLFLLHLPRDSFDSHSSFSTDVCDSSCPSSVTNDDPHLRTNLFPATTTSNTTHQKKPNRYFSLSRFSSVLHKETKPPATTTTPVDPDIITGYSVKRMSMTMKEVIRKFLKKAKPLYEKLSHRQCQAF